jgi:hypothetical protein
MPGLLSFQACSLRNTTMCATAVSVIDLTPTLGDVDIACIRADGAGVTDPLTCNPQPDGSILLNVTVKTAGRYGSSGSSINCNVDLSKNTLIFKALFLGARLDVDKNDA